MKSIREKYMFFQKDMIGIRITAKSGPYGPIRALWVHMGPNPDRAPTGKEQQANAFLIFFAFVLRKYRLVHKNLCLAGPWIPLWHGNVAVTPISHKEPPRAQRNGTVPGYQYARSALDTCLLVFIKSEAFRVQTAPFDKIRIDLWRSPEASTHLRPSGSQKTKA